MSLYIFSVGHSSKHTVNIFGVIGTLTKKKKMKIFDLLSGISPLFDV